MPEIKITLPDNSVRIFDHQPTTLEVAQSIGPRLAKDTLGAKINGLREVIDLRLPLEDGTRLEIVTMKCAGSAIYLARRKSNHRASD